MKNTETHFGLVEIDGKISADNGKTFLPQVLSNSERSELIMDIESYLEHPLTEQESNDLNEILS